MVESEEFDELAKFDEGGGMLAEDPLQLHPELSSYD